MFIGGVYGFSGAIVAGVFTKLVPALLDNWNLPPDLLLILFGVGVLQVLLTAPQGLAVQFPKDMAKLGTAPVPADDASASASSAQSVWLRKAAALEPEEAAMMTDWGGEPASPSVPLPSG